MSAFFKWLIFRAICTLTSWSAFSVVAQLMSVSMLNKARQKINILFNFVWRYCHNERMDPWDSRRWWEDSYSSESSNQLLLCPDASRKLFLDQPYTMQFKKPCMGAVKLCQQTDTTIYITLNEWRRAVTGSNLYIVFLTNSSRRATRPH